MKVNRSGFGIQVVDTRNESKQIRLILTMKVNRSGFGIQGFSIQVVDTHNESKQIRF